jgi:hypothetical protein
MTENNCCLYLKLKTRSPPHKVIQVIKQIMLIFIWGGKRDNNAQRGFNVCDIKLIKHLTDNVYANWKTISN